MATMMSVIALDLPNNVHISIRSTMDAASVKRYSRQAIIPQVRSTGQSKLQAASVLVVGAGGIGSTVIMYLAGAGIGRITIVDNDAVEESNLHRQIIHDTTRVGSNKAVSAVESARKLNPLVNAVAVPERFTAANAIELVSAHDVIVDATDNAQARYLINDSCVLCPKPLVSGSAIGFDCQLSIFDSRVGPCYRCLYPTLSATEACRSCSDSGVLGPVPGLIGTMQAIEVIKYIAQCGTPLLGKQLYYDALNAEWQSFTLPSKLEGCRVCSPTADITSAEISEQTTQAALSSLATPPPVIPQEKEISPQDYASLRSNNARHVLLDVRAAIQYDMINLSGSHNIPLASIDQATAEVVASMRETEDVPVYCICRRGIASKKAVLKLAELGVKNIYSVRGGLNAWHREIDHDFPFY